MRVAGLLVAAALLSGCAARAPVLASLTQPSPQQVRTELTETPFFPQQRYHCGPAALATVLNASGLHTEPDALAPMVYVPARRGSLQLELLAASRRLGRVPYVIAPQLDDLLAELDAGRPVLVLQNLGLDSVPTWHYAVVIGYDLAQDQIVLRSGVTRREVMRARRFVDTWRRADYWGLVALRPGELPARADPDRYLRAVAATESTSEPGLRLASYRAARTRWPDNTLARFGIATSLHELGDLDEAERTYRGLLDEAPAHVPALHNLAEILSDRGCHAAAMRTIDRAITADDGAWRVTLQDTRNALVERGVGTDPGSCPPRARDTE